VCRNKFELDTLDDFKMRYLDGSAFPAFDALIGACNAYGALTGGRFDAEDFAKDADGAFVKAPVLGDADAAEAFDAARASAAPVVETYAVLVRDDSAHAVLLEEYRRAHCATVHEAALSTMLAALRSVDVLGPPPPPEETPPVVAAADDGGTSSDVADTRDAASDVTLAEVVADPWDVLVAKLGEIAAHRKSARGREHLARVHAASFVADFGASTGAFEGRVDASDDDELVRCFHERLASELAGDDDADAATTKGPPACCGAPADTKDKADDDDDGPGARTTFASPYAELAGVDSIDAARAWCARHPDQFSNATAIGGAVLGGVALGVLALWRLSAAGGPGPRRGRR